MTLQEEYANYRKYGSGATLQEFRPEPTTYTTPPKHVPSEQLLDDVKTLLSGKPIIIRKVIDIQRFQPYLETHELSVHDILFAVWRTGKQQICGSLIHNWYNVTYGRGVADKIINGHKCLDMDMLPPQYVKSFKSFCEKCCKNET